MTTEELLSDLEPGTKLSIQNEPFSYIGKANVRLKGADRLTWLYDKNGSMLSIDPETDEMMLFQVVEEEIDRAEEDDEEEKREETVFYRNQEFTSAYVDEGSVMAVHDGAPFDDGETFELHDYENDDKGLLLRVIHVEATGEDQVYLGTVVVEEDVLSRG